MKGTIRENLGASRYIVGVRSAVQPLADEIEKYTKLYQATIPKITEAYGVLNERRVEYQAALAVVAAAAAEYEICRQAFSVSTCIDAGNAACNAAYLEADAACLEIESGIGECDDDCQRDRLRCHETAVRVLEACLAVVAIDCAEAEYQHILECQTTHSPLIAKAQAAALALLPGMQDALSNLQHEQALQWQLARKLNELEGIDQREQQITCFIAQWSEALAAGDEVELARTPNGRTVITSLVTAPTPCLHDARVLPSGHLFVNAAIFPGFETWRPSWRVATVLAQAPPNLQVQFAPAIMVGSLGTLYSKTPLDCTPPQCYFDGVDPKVAEADIRAARSALSAAQTLLLEAVAVRTACVDVYDQAWMDQCYGTGVEACDAEFGAAMEQPTLDKGACYDEAQGNCEAQTTAGLEACTLAYQPAIDDAQGEVDAATIILDHATSDLTDAQNALAVIEAEIQACIDEASSQEWLDARRQELTEGCDHSADFQKEQCLDNGGTAGECQAIWDAEYAACLMVVEEVLPLNQSSAIETCQNERQPDVDAAQVVIDAAYTAVLNAEIALGQVQASLELAQQALTDCQGEWVLADCLEAALQFCDDTYALAEDTYTQRRAACYQEAMAECDRQRDEAIDACYAANADAIDAAQQSVDEAVRGLEIAIAGRYNPADPLILTLPVAHCQAELYQPGDSVLVDFPTRSGETAMAVWGSARVIGWADNTRICQPAAWPPWVGINLVCVMLAWARRRGKYVGVTSTPHDPRPIIAQLYDCPVEDWESGIANTPYAYHSKITSAFVYESFDYPGFEFTIQPGIAYETAYADSPERLIANGSYYFYTDGFTNRRYLRKNNYDMILCDPQYEPGNLSSGSSDTTEYLIPDHNQQIIEVLGIPATATLRHIETGAEKIYTIRADSLGANGTGLIDPITGLPADPSAYSGGLTVDYDPPPEDEE